MITEAKTIDENLSLVNPAFNSKKPEYRQNCQRCVPAYEMRRRGYDVIAQPAKINSSGKLHKDDPVGKNWKSVFKDADYSFYTDYDGGKNEIIKQLKSWGDGAVAEIRVLWNAQEAHVFVGEVINGIVRFVDPQSGDSNCERYFTDAVIGGTMMARIDNLEVTELIEKCIKNRGGKP